MKNSYYIDLRFAPGIGLLFFRDKVNYKNDPRVNSIKSITEMRIIFLFLIIEIGITKYK